MPHTLINNVNNYYLFSGYHVKGILVTLSYESFQVQSSQPFCGDASNSLQTRKQWQSQL